MTKKNAQKHAFLTIFLKKQQKNLVGKKSSSIFAPANKETGGG